MKVIDTVGSRPPFGRSVIILLGGPGAGKGTQAQAICGWLKIPHISSGQLLRVEVAAATPLGFRAKAIVDAGGLVGDDLVNELILKRIRQDDCSSGFILDGYPRHVGQAVALEASLPLEDRQIVIEIVTQIEQMLPRLTNRRTCKSCSAIYHLIASPPTQPGVCDHCGNALMQRSDDHEDVIRERFKTYYASTETLTFLYKRMGIYHGVDGMRPADQVTRDIRQLLERELAGKPSTVVQVAAD